LIYNLEAAVGDTLEMDILKGYYSEQFEIYMWHDLRQWWEVVDKTAQMVVVAADWEFSPDTGRVIFRCPRTKEPSVNRFVLILQICNSTFMNNHLTNHWTGEYAMSVDPMLPEVREQISNFLTVHRT
jgi:hypothetical protein